MVQRQTYNDSHSFENRSRSVRVCESQLAMQAKGLTHLLVMLDLEDEMLNHPLCHIYMAVYKQAQRNKVRVPVVQLEAASQRGLNTISRYSLH